MRDAGLEQAIKAAGGVASLARAIGIAQPSVSAWSRIPAERVLAVESLTRVHRFILRPDLYGPSEGQVSAKSEVDEIDQLRAAEYGLLSLLLGKAPDTDTLSRVAALKGDASDLGGRVDQASAGGDVGDAHQLGAVVDQVRQGGGVELAGLVVGDDDDLGFFPKYNVSVSIRSELLNRYPQIATVLKPVMDKITNDVMIQLNAETDVQGRDWSEVARDWLRRNGFITDLS